MSSADGASSDALVSVGTVKMIGFLLAICGNTLIACSLTLQKSAHNMLNNGAATTSTTAATTSTSSSTSSSTSDDSTKSDDLVHLRDNGDDLTTSLHQPPPPTVPSAQSAISSVTITSSTNSLMSSTERSTSVSTGAATASPAAAKHNSNNNNSTNFNMLKSFPEQQQQQQQHQQHMHDIDPVDSQLRLPPSVVADDYDMYSRARTHLQPVSNTSSTTSSAASSVLNMGPTDELPLPNSSRSNTGFAFLRNPTWWIGTFLMAAGEIGNFAAFAYAPASLVAPLGAWSVVLSAILAHVFLHETISNVNLIGITLCVAGAFLIGTSGPDVSAAEAALDAAAVYRLLIRLPFVIFIVLTVTATAGLIYISHRTTLGQRYIFVYVGVSSLLGAVTVVCAKALSTFLRLTIEGNSQFGNWLPFGLGIILGSAILAQLRYLNLAMSQFGNAQVIPVYYVLFTTCAMTSGVIMYREFEQLTVRNLPFFVGICSTMSGVFLVSRSARPGDERNGSPLPVNNGHAGSSAYRSSSSSSSKRSRTQARYERVLPVSPMSSPRSGQQSMWA